VIQDRKKEIDQEIATIAEVKDKEDDTDEFKFKASMLSDKFRECYYGMLLK
jgi:hypothetical protein